MLEIKNLSVRYGHIEALNDVSFQVNKGSIVSIIGSNGAGKSTLLNTISGLVKRCGGEILLDGTPLPTASHKVVRRNLVQVPEGRRVFPGLTITENLIMGGYRVNAAKSRKKIPEMFSLFPILGTRCNQMAGTLSGGEQQMLAIARGLMAEPEILLLDEPSLGLAPIIVTQMFEIIEEINRKMGITILIVEQNASQAMDVSHYTYVLENGKVVTQGPSAELKASDDIRKSYLGG
ncbi:ABC transporter ATP-binding protein [Oscillospiraceae bacterium MB08-C2-2]|nr:ABC transporter ATP-binding protein [Oscillospiraceae bacterium MB08-C2-2]